MKKEKDLRTEMNLNIEIWSGDYQLEVELSLHKEVGQGKAADTEGINLELLKYGRKKLTKTYPL